MPMNASTYLEGHGWRGKGVPLDGQLGRGLKKPLALPMKRNVKGLGKERDRATEWWDCLFEASAKKLQAPASPADVVVEAAVAVAADPSTATTRKSPSLIALAKREHARKQLMSGFVRGKPNKEHDEQAQQLERILAEQEKAASISTERAASAQATDEKADAQAEMTKEERKEAKRKRKEDKAARRTEENGLKEERASKKRKHSDKASGSEVRVKELPTKAGDLVSSDVGTDVAASARAAKVARREQRKRRKAAKTGDFVDSSGIDGIVDDARKKKSNSTS